MDETFAANREFLKSGSFPPVMAVSGQARGLPAPSAGLDRGGRRITLPAFDDPGQSALITRDYVSLLLARRSIREYSSQPMTAAQLAFLLWSMNSVQGFRDDPGQSTLRPVPSGGARHTFEVYFAALNISGLEPGLYHYLPLENVGSQAVTIEWLAPLPDQETVRRMLVGQDWTAQAGALFFISTIPERAEWRYGRLAHRMILTDLGYLGQNFMLSATALGLGSCQMAGYDQELCDQVFGLDGSDEFYLIAASAGTITPEAPSFDPGNGDKAEQ